MIEQFSAVNPVVPRIVVVIVDWKKIKDVKAVISDCFYRSMCIVNAVGTCRSELLDMLGIGSEEKALLAFFQPYFRAKEIMAELAEKLEFNRPGGGVAFSLPLSGISRPVFRNFSGERLSLLLESLTPSHRERVSEFVGKMGESTEASLLSALEPCKKAGKPPGADTSVSERVLGLLSRIRQNPDLKACDILGSGEAEALIGLIREGASLMGKASENETEKASSAGAEDGYVAMRDTSRDAYSYDLIISIVNQGFSDDLMDAARSAGARGGTVIQARGTNREDTVRFFGISLQEEKEIIAILTRRDTRKNIMKAINSACGSGTEAQGVIFSLPVDGVAGIGNVQ